MIHRFFVRIFGFIKRYISNGNDWRRQEKYKNLNIGVGTAISYENLDGIAPQLSVIGSFCVFAPKSVVLTHDASLLPVEGGYVFKRTVIGDRVFIGYGAVIMPGVSIGNSVVVGSNSVVTKDVPSGYVVAGVPAKIICSVEELINKKRDDLVKPPFDWTVGVSDKDLMKLQKLILSELL